MLDPHAGVAVVLHGGEQVHSHRGCSHDEAPRSFPPYRCHRAHAVGPLQPPADPYVQLLGGGSDNEQLSHAVAGCASSRSCTSTGSRSCDSPGSHGRRPLRRVKPGVGVVVGGGGGGGGGGGRGGGGTDGCNTNHQHALRADHSAAVRCRRGSRGEGCGGRRRWRRDLLVHECSRRRAASGVTPLNKLDRLGTTMGAELSSCGVSSAASAG
mmetsp:Transcript_25062/g.61814  ORF Transcript_25062/g.61814 Transcript_25062/m.61814 type:complete len:211 (+) Transcript_25062:687-1319(+)